jgi:hypothetical protein
MLYTPRRAGKRWLEDAPVYILDVLDNNGKTADRYTVLFSFPISYALDKFGAFLKAGAKGEYGNTYIQYLGMSDNPSHPQGVSMWGEMKAYEAAGYRYRCKHQRIRWNDLPQVIRDHVRARAEED